MTDYEKAQSLGLTKIDRWSKGHKHHPMSKRLMAFLEAHDFNDYADYFGWKSGGDGDNGETLMFEMDAFFELADEAVAPEEYKLATKEDVQAEWDDCRKTIAKALKPKKRRKK